MKRVERKKRRRGKRKKRTSLSVHSAAASCSTNGAVGASGNSLQYPFCDSRGRPTSVSFAPRDSRALPPLPASKKNFQS
jgi:hypothetical protein